MKILAKSLVLILFLIGILSCSEIKDQGLAKGVSKSTPTPKEMSSDTVFKSSELIIIKRSEHVYQHISYLKTKDFGNVECNGMLVTKNKESVCFDTPTEDKASKELLIWLNDSLGAKLLAIVPTHFHADCVGGLKEFVDKKIPIIASNKTIDFLTEKSDPFVNKMTGFKDSIRIPLADTSVLVQFFGAGHTKDNVVAYFAPDQTLFGGCLVKELGASKGNLEDADTSAWSKTIEYLKASFPEVELIIPGHGKPGNIALLDYTDSLFKKK